VLRVAYPPGAIAALDFSVANTKSGFIVCVSLAGCGVCEMSASDDDDMRWFSKIQDKK
jgi:hypothetical protein